MELRFLGDYQIIKSIGQGTLGTVYIGEHRFMKRQYVIKVLPEELATDRGFIQRFEEDVAALAELDHPHIVKIHQVSYDQGQYFLISDCIVDDFGETTNLAQYMLSRGKRLEEDELFRLLRQIAEALDYAHSKKGNAKGIVHRNLKLNNILIGKGKGGVDLYISDFGLMRIIGTGAVLSRTYKNVAEALGIGSIVSTKAALDRYPNPGIETLKLTPLHTSFLQNFAFLAPEQKRLDSLYPVDYKVDTYAFGVLVYYLLTGELPEGYFDMPSTKAPDYKGNWDYLVQWCLQTDPANRPGTMVEALEAVRYTDRIVNSSFNAPTEVSSSETFKHSENANIIEAETPNYLAQSFLKSPTIMESLFVPVSVSANGPSEDQMQPCATQNLHAAFSSGTPVNSSVSSLPESSSQEVLNETLRPVLQTSQLERPNVDLDPGAAFLVDSSVKHYSPELREIKNIQPIQTEMKVIKGGDFYRGSSDGNRDELPRHQVSINSFAIDIHPVTNEQFVRFLDVMGGEKDSNHNDIIRLKESRIKRTAGRLLIESGYAKHPVVGVTWYGAVAYAKWVGKRLPSEAEWEIAACGGNEHMLYPTGEDIEKTQANFFSSDTTSVMSYAPNGIGLYDMAGNVYEWCYDWYSYTYYEISVQEPENPIGPLQGVYRVLRGGCWKSLKEDLRCSRRHRNNPGTVNGTYGFRCAADVQ